MDSNEANNSSITLDMIRKTAISRRGGVKVRGGRLPPIRIRDVPTTSTKKVITPKIPQRRITFKKEAPELSEVHPVFIKDERKGFRKSFNRGRGQRVYIQTEGSFLEQGPALRLKKDTVEPHYERISRSSSRTKAGMDIKINASEINLLLEEYDEKYVDLDCEYNMRPIRFPIVKLESEVRIKEEIFKNEDTKPSIKVEILDNEDVPDEEKILENGNIIPKIKEEPEDNADETKEKFTLPDVKATKQEILEPKICSLMEAIKLSRDEDLFILFQLPSCLPFKKFDESSDQITKKGRGSDEKREKVENSQDEAKTTSLKDLPEGSVGKLQILKSGRMRLALGTVDIAIESGLNEGSTAEVVSIPLVNKDEGNFIVLGKIYQKMIMHPILTDLEKEIKNEKTSEC